MEGIFPENRHRNSLNRQMPFNHMALTRPGNLYFYTSADLPTTFYSVGDVRFWIPIHHVGTVPQKAKLIYVYHDTKLCVENSLILVPTVYGFDYVSLMGWFSAPLYFFVAIQHNLFKQQPLSIKQVPGKQ